MKKTLLLLVLTLCGSYRVMSQGGTIQFQNSTVTTAFFTNNPSGPAGKVSTNAGTMIYGLFYSDATLGGVSNNLTFATAFGNSTLGFGVINGNTSVELLGTNPGDQAWIMVLAWDAALGLNGYTHYLGAYGSGPAGAASTQWDGAGQWFLQTRTIRVSLGAFPFPGSVMFQNPGNANFIGGLADETIFSVPEPSVLALVASCVVTAGLFRRRKKPEVLK
jgi:hypothetical protein